MTVSSDPESYGQLTVYRIGSAPLPPGPAIVAAQSDSTPSIASEITLLGSTGSKVTFGNLQLVPIAQGLLYVRPVYVQPSGGSQAQVYLRKMIVTYNNRSVMDDSLTEAINEMFPGAGVSLREVIDGEGAPVEPPTTDGDAPAATPEELLAEAERLFSEADLLSVGDLAEYARLTGEARLLVREALQLLDPEAAAAVAATVPSTSAPVDDAGSGTTGGAGSGVPLDSAVPVDSTPVTTSTTPAG